LDVDSGGGGSGHSTGSLVMLTAANATGPGNASNPLRGTAGSHGSPGRVVLTFP
jgi:hypothetical protein